MFENYLNYSNIPSGDILRRILTKKKISQKQLAERSGILPQRINDYVMNKRRFTVESSMKIEDVLNIDIPGFFYLVQSKHDVYKLQQSKANNFTPDLSKIRRNLFWDIDMFSLNWIECKRSVVQRCFEYGNDEEIKEIISFYGKNDVREILDSITENWKREDRMNMYKKYLE